MSAQEHSEDPLEAILSGLEQTDLEHMEQNLRTVLRLLDLADLASASFHVGDYELAFVALTDYHALRNEMAQTPFRI